MGIHAPFPQLLAPRSGILVSQALVLTHRALELYFGMAWHPIVCTSGMCSWIQNFPVDSGTWQHVRPISIDSAWRGYSTSFFRRPFSLHQHLRPEVGKGATAPLRQRARLRDKVRWWGQPSKSRCLWAMGWCFLSRGGQWVAECDEGFTELPGSFPSPQQSWVTSWRSQVTRLPKWGRPLKPFSPFLLLSYFFSVSDPQTTARTIYRIFIGRLEFYRHWIT